MCLPGTIRKHAALQVRQGLVSWRGPAFFSHGRLYWKKGFDHSLVFEFPVFGSYFFTLKTYLSLPTFWCGNRVHRFLDGYVKCDWNFVSHIRHCSEQLCISSFFLYGKKREEDPPSLSPSPPIRDRSYTGGMDRHSFCSVCCIFFVYPAMVIL